LGQSVEALIKLNLDQQMCYYDGKLFGGYLALLLDQILADCCQPTPAMTAYLNTTFVCSVSPGVPIRLSAWPEKIEGRKIYLTGSIQVPGSGNGELIDAVKASALFIRPR
jgi:acyl-coenzyme A thioesterase PaaI-like protein